MKCFSAAAASVLILLVSACGDGNAIDDAPAALAQAYCNAAAQCAGALFEYRIGRPDTCTTERTAWFANGVVQQWKEKIDAGTIIYDGAKMRDCIDAIDADPCGMLGYEHPNDDSGSWWGRTFGPLPAVCEDAVKGQVAVGGACAIDAECEGTAWCDTSAACPGTCADRKAAGTACNEDRECRDGLVCNETCVTLAAVGEACGGTAPVCGPGLYCGDDPAATCLDPNASMTADEGATCNVDTGPLCKDGLSCVVTADLTMACAAPSASGAACRPGIPDPCPAGEYCNVDWQNLGRPSTCRPWPKAGEACGTTFSPTRCEPGAGCDDHGTCRTMQDDGGACDGDEVCYSGYCDASGRCDVPPDCPVE